MTTYKASNKNGQNIINRYKRDIGFELCDVYGSYSYEKEKAYRYCYRCYIENECSISCSFHICSKNRHGFTCGWRGNDPLFGEFIRFYTKDNTYTVWLDL